MANKKQQQMTQAQLKKEESRSGGHMNTAARNLHETNYRSTVQRGGPARADVGRLSCSPPAAPLPMKQRGAAFSLSSSAAPPPSSSGPSSCQLLLFSMRAAPFTK